MFPLRRSSVVALAGGAVCALAVGCSDGATASTAAATTPATPTTVVTESAAGVRLTRVVGGLGDALFVTGAPGMTNRLFIVQQSGTVRVLERGRLTARPFLDLRGQVSSRGEQGLLGLAFHPDFATNRRVFASYTDLGGDSRIVEYRARPDGLSVDPASVRMILAQDQPYANHNGGMVVFGPDRMLYIGLGDGGSGGDPENRAQDLSTLLGKILRIDVSSTATPYAIPTDNPFRSTGGARGEIWHYGLRNPWRFSFDRATGDMWIGDVGQNAIEEVDRAPAGRGGLNFGWNAFEGRRPFGGPLNNAVPHTRPVAQYTHADGVSVTGGYVYRGRRVPALRGRYLYADYGSGRVWSLRAGSSPGGLRDETRRLKVRLGAVTSFGEGVDGDLYVIANQSLYRFTR